MILLRLLNLPLAMARLAGQSALLALSQVWANKVRSALTMIGIVIGVASVTAVIAALTGLKTNVLRDFEAFGTNKIFIAPRRPDTGPQRHAPWRTLAFTPRMFDDLQEHCPSVEAFTRITRTTLTVKSGKISLADVAVTGVDPAWHNIENRWVRQGRPFSHVDALRGTNVCLIDSKLQEKLQLDRDCTGQSILVGSRTFVIIGLLDPRAETSIFGGEGRGLEIFVPFEAGWKMTESVNFVLASCRSPELSDDARAELRFFLRRARHIAMGQPDNFEIETVEEYLRRFTEVATIITLVAGGIVGISLLVGGVGIMNIMLVSVSERTREIGLRKAVGARPSVILLQFLVEAVMLCLLGGLIGLLGGQLLTAIMAAIPAAKLEKAYIPLWAVGLAFGFAATVGLVFGMFPAIKAARLDPIEALRHE